MKKSLLLRVYLPREVLSLGATGSLSAGVVLLLRASLGGDPVSVFLQGVQRSSGMSFALSSIAFNCVALLIVWLTARRYLGGGTVISGLALGPLVAVFFSLFNGFAFQLAPLWLRFALIALAGVLLGLGVALSVSNNFGLSCYDALTLWFCRSVRLPLWWGKIGCDGLMVLLGVFLGGRVGWGTLLVALGVGPLVGCWLSCCRRIVEVVHSFAKETGANARETWVARLAPLLTSNAVALDC